MEPNVEDVGPSGFICTQKQRENVLVSFTSLTHAGHGKKTKEWDGRGAHSYTDGMDSPAAQTQRENVLVSFALLKASVADARWAWKENKRVGWEGSA